MRENRTHARHPCDVPVTCHTGDGNAIIATARNISVSGMFIESAQKLPFNTQIEIVIRLPGAAQDSKLPAVVRWSDKVGFGVQFGLLGALETHLIAELTRG